MSVSGKRILVTGGTGKLGRVLVPALLDQGAWVAVTYRDNESLASLLECVDADGPQPKAIQCDLADADSVRALADTLAQTNALPLDGIALLAGGWAGGASVWDAPASQLHEMVRTNLLTTWNVLRQFTGGMVEAGYGRIVTVGARHAAHAVKGNAAYAAAKAAVAALTATLAEDLRGTGVTAACVVPWKMRAEAGAGVAAYADVVPMISWLLGEEGAIAHGDLLSVYGPS